MKIRRLLRNLHRDLGYLIMGMLIIYVVSGIALNHRKDWNPDHRVVSEVIQVQQDSIRNYTSQEIEALLNAFDYVPIYRKHFLSSQQVIKVFVENGMVVYDPIMGSAEMELLIKRPLFYPINKLHMAATSKAWIWVSDILSVILLFVGLSGLFLLKGKYGITGRGLWLTLFGFAIPLYFLIFHVS